jgi:hypothetical protein
LGFEIQKKKKKKKTANKAANQREGEINK